MSSILAYQRVGNLMQNDLLYLIQAAILHKVLTNGYAPCTKVTLPCSTKRAVKTK